ncbi:aldo/keto reductase [Rhizobium sp. 32-5/1]|uniref:aldo/keto reductase n=1 Tax=Rhizobium sp. 32-5/1 TaxID=3019602 RepID=UPI00240D3E2D|nr:aldo/keto reductase [Rhizobium sp. 32-5/1]WEZ84986.1 aldo/keto reductase [Rhizobium sp. 32-5/1]
MKKRNLGSELSVSAIGLGCMGMSHAYGGAEEADSIKALHRAVEIGISFFDTAEVYGPFTNEILVGKALGPYRDKVTIATKFGFRVSTTDSLVKQLTGVDSSPKNVKAVAEASLKRLGIDVIDLYYQHRVDPDVPIEETVGAMADLVREGKVRALGLSEASAATIRRAHAVHPIAAVQSEYSLWTREPEENVLDTCRELGIGFVPFSPLGRGMLTGKLTLDDLGADDMRRGLPRFQGENFDANAALVAKLGEIASQKGVTAAQLALAWVLAQGDFIVPIPGARKIRNIEENAAAADIVLSPEELATLGAIITPEAAAGARYTEAMQAMTNR